MEKITGKFVGSLMVATYLGLCAASIVQAQDKDDRTSKFERSSDVSEGIDDEDIYALGPPESTPYLRFSKGSRRANSALTLQQVASVFPRNAPSDEARECLKNTEKPDRSDDLLDVAFQLTVDSKGEVTKLDAQPRETSKKTAACIAEDLRSMQFPNSGGTSNVDLRLRYNPRASTIWKFPKRMGLSAGAKHKLGSTKTGIGTIDDGDHAKSDSVGGPEMSTGTPQVEGSLDKEIIRKVVRHHRREIKYCYELELQKHPELEGKLLVKFTISATGDVVAAVVQKDTLNNDAVAECVENKIRRWVFPEPKGGGVVVVKYPFVFGSK